MSEKKEKTNDKRKKNKGLGLKRLALFLLIIILTSSVALYAFLEINPVRIFSEGITGLYNTVISKGKDELTQKTRTITTYNTNKPVHMAAASSNIAVADSDSVRIYDAEGVEKAYIPVSLNRPFIQSYKKNILISDIKGRYLAVINDGKILWQRHLEEDIVFTNISDNWILIITKSKESGYKRTVRAWTIDGQEVAYRNISNYYPVAAWHYPEFEKSTFLINGVDASGLEVNGFFDLLDLTMNQKASIRGENEVVAKGIPVGENLMLYGEKRLVMINQQLSTVWEKKFEEPAITAANVINNKYPVFAHIDTGVLNRENRYITNIEILEPDSSVKNSFVVNSLVSSIASYGRTAALTAGYEVLFINQHGEIIDTYTALSEITDICFASEDICYVMSGGVIERVKVKTGSKILGIF